MAAYLRLFFALTLVLFVSLVFAEGKNRRVNANRVEFFGLTSYLPSDVTVCSCNNDCNRCKDYPLYECTTYQNFCTGADIGWVNITHEASGAYTAKIYGDSSCATLQESFTGRCGECKSIDALIKCSASSLSSWLSPFYA